MQRPAQSSPSSVIVSSALSALWPPMSAGSSNSSPLPRPFTINPAAQRIVQMRDNGPRLHRIRQFRLRLMLSALTGFGAWLLLRFSPVGSSVDKVGEALGHIRCWSFCILFFLSLLIRVSILIFPRSDGSSLSGGDGESIHTITRALFARLLSAGWLDYYPLLLFLSTSRHHVFVLGPRLCLVCATPSSQSTFLPFQRSLISSFYFIFSLTPTCDRIPCLAVDGTIVRVNFRWGAACKPTPILPLLAQDRSTLGSHSI